jgi:hypothetical protein
MEDSSPEQDSPNRLRNNLFWWAGGLAVYAAASAYRVRGFDPPFAPYGLLLSFCAGAVFCLRGALRLWTPLTEEDYQPRPFPLVDSVLSWLLVLLLVSGFIVGIASAYEAWHKPSYPLIVAALLSFPLPVFAYVAWRRIKEATAHV